MTSIKLYTNRHCPVCERVKEALKDLPHEIYPTEIHMDDLISEVTARGVSMDEIHQAPVMVAPGCDIVWTGEDCLIAIEEEEWEGPGAAEGD